MIHYLAGFITGSTLVGIMWIAYAHARYRSTLVRVMPCWFYDNTRSCPSTWLDAMLGLGNRPHVLHNGTWQCVRCYATQGATHEPLNRPRSGHPRNRDHRRNRLRSAGHVHDGNRAMMQWTNVID